jgi:UDP-N-acetylglucosamine--N-acetylmuramyl-(pentapeptide) pyrophosphoryl-undecaprenol N-acetylglucosamine transferase
MRVIMAGGGTGGHLYPALAIADKIARREPDSDILFIGAKKEVSSDIIESNGYELVKVDVRGFDRKHLTRNVAVVKALAASGAQIRKILKEFKPDAVVGTGGYVSGPVIREASKRGIPTFIHEQNVIPGVANKLAAKYADEIFVAFAPAKEHFKEKGKITVTGNPVRRAFITAGAIDYREKLGIGASSTAVMIFGGSQGADRINEVASEMITSGVMSGSGTADGRLSRVDFFFLTGRRQYFEIRERLTAAGVLEDGHVRLIDYTELIHEYYAASDLIICRSGALTVSEIAAMGKASILIPSPNVTNNHQYYNAKVLADAGAAVIIDEPELTASSLTDEILKLSTNKEHLNRMAEAALSIAKADATDVIYSHIEKRVTKRTEPAV